MEKNLFVWWFLNETTGTVKQGLLAKLKLKLRKTPEIVREDIKERFNDLIVSASAAGIPVHEINITPEMLFERLQKHFAKKPKIKS